MSLKEKSQTKCALCDKRLNNNQKKDTITEKVGGTRYTFDSKECVLLFKKFRSVYGPDCFSTC